MYNCKNCNKEFNLKQGKTNHEKYCSGLGTKKDIKKQKTGDCICELCGYSISYRQIKKHKVYCNGLGPKKFRIGLGLGWTAGKTYIEIYGEKRAKEIGNKISKKLIGKCSGMASTPEKEIERRNKLRIAINKRYENGWDPKCGRCLKYDYESPIAGKIKVDGNWELNVAKYLDNIKVNWIRNEKRFEYVNLSGNISTYKPDFYIYDWNAYLEIKGYETKLDKCKWSQFKEPLIIWKKEKLIELKILLV